MSEEPGFDARPVEPPAPPSARLLRWASVGFYLLLAAGGLVWTRLRTGIWLPASLPGRDPGTGAALGLGTAMVVVLLSGWMLRVDAMRWLAAEFKKLLGETDLATTAVIALTSGIGEELLFRGAMQPACGFVLTSIVFGLIHVGPDRRYLPWTVFAVMMGFLFGAILETTQSLVGPILAHCTINFLNLRRISRLGPEPPAPSIP